MDPKTTRESFYEHTNSSERVLSPHHHIDPGFLNYRLCFSIFGGKFHQAFEERRKEIKDHLDKLYNHHLLVDMVLQLSTQVGIKSLGQVLQAPGPKQLFCSTELIEGNKEIYTKPGVQIRIVPQIEYEKEIFLEFHTEHMVASTGFSELAGDNLVSMIGEIHKIEESQIIVRPLVMGAPTYDYGSNYEKFGSDFVSKISWEGYSFYELFPEDIDEFSAVKNVTNPEPSEWMGVMKNLSEEQVKSNFCTLLGDVPRKDWAGEQADHFTGAITIDGKKKTAAFLFKGPAHFREMTPDLLGKRSDQIYRLSTTPADILIVQHCHHIAEAVRATLRAFAVTPSNPRHYCVFDGKDTYKLFKAYNLMG